MEIITKTLIELFNFFEPAFFKGKFYILNELDNNFVLPENKSKLITFNKERLINQIDDFVIQIIDNNLYLWEEFDISSCIEMENILIYHFKKNKEFFIANKEKIEITEVPFGSRFSNEFWELSNFLQKYAISKIKNSSCPIFNRSWYDGNKIFFKSGNNDIPEKYMQESLKNFIDDIRIFKGEIGQFESDREHTLGAERPVDVLIKWEKSNRVALIEIKWLGKSIKENKKITSTHTNSRANEGYIQLKDYYELAKKDYPTKIIKCYLVVIDGRRWKTNDKTISISFTDGMHYSTEELKIKDSIQYWKTYPNIEEPIRMFVEPKCEM